MILLFGGTTEGKEVASFLHRAGLPFLYSTKTSVSREGLPPSGKYRSGPLKEPEMTALCHQEGVRTIVDAAHPFAGELHQTVARVAKKTGIPAIRFDRRASEKVRASHVRYVADLPEAEKALREAGVSSLLALTGVQSIPVLKPYWQEHPTWFRILPRAESKEAAIRAGFDSRRLIMAYPSNDVETERQMLDRFNPMALLTKDSGAPAGMEAKIEAARTRDIPVFIVERPPIPANFEVVKSLEELGRILGVG